MDTRPEWMPEWVWREFQDGKWSDSASEKLLRVIGDRGCACVWQAMDSRRGEHARRHAARCRDKFGTNPIWDLNEAGSLFSWIEGSCDAIPDHDAIPGTTRREKGARIAKLAKHLRDELTALFIDDVGFPDVFRDALYDLARTRASAIFEHYKGQPGINEVTAPPFEECAVWMELAHIESTTDVPGTLTTIENAAIEWAKSKPPVAQLGSEGALRLYFIREMTSFFRKGYGTPLREQVAALTRSVFECEMDAATVAKLAP